MARRRVNPHLVPDRAFIADITTRDAGREFTFTGVAYGPTPEEAERRELAARRAVSVRVRYELPTR